MNKETANRITRTLNCIIIQYKSELSDKTLVKSINATHDHTINSYTNQGLQVIPLCQERGTQRFTFLICIKMFILKLQARNPENLLQANMQSPTRTKIPINQMFVRLFSYRFVNID